MQNESLNTLETRRAALLKQLTRVGPMIQGSVCHRRVKCGKPQCRCAQGELHEACVLTKKVAGKTVTTHVPRDLRDEVDAWSREHRRVKALLKQISDLSEKIVRTHVTASRAAAQNVARASRAPGMPTPSSSDTTCPDSSRG